MLSKKDKEWLEEMTVRKIREALTVKVRMERRRDIRTGQPLATPEIEVLDVYLPDHWVEFLPHYEASIRGVQETTDHVKNGMGTMAAIILALEVPIKSLGQFSEEINKRIEAQDILKLEGG